MINWIQFIKSLFKLWFLNLLLSILDAILLFNRQLIELGTHIVLISQLILLIYIGYADGKKIWPHKPGFGGALLTIVFFFVMFLSLPLYRPMGLTLGLPAEAFDGVNWEEVWTLIFFALPAFLGGKLYQYVVRQAKQKR